MKLKTKGWKLFLGATIMVILAGAIIYEGYLFMEYEGKSTIFISNQSSSDMVTLELRIDSSIFEVGNYKNTSQIGSAYSFDGWIVGRRISVRNVHSTTNARLRKYLVAIPIEKSCSDEWVSTWCILPVVRFISIMYYDDNVFEISVSYREPVFI